MLVGLTCRFRTRTSACADVAVLQADMVLQCFGYDVNAIVNTRAGRNYSTDLIPADKATKTNTKQEKRKKEEKKHYILIFILESEFSHNGNLQDFDGHRMEITGIKIGYIRNVIKGTICWVQCVWGFSRWYVVAVELICFEEKNHQLGRYQTWFPPKRFVKQPRDSTNNT